MRVGHASFSISLASWAIALSAVLGCGGDDGPHTGKHDIWFMGAAIDGATGAPVADYKVTLVWGSNTISGKVDATTHRYVIGPLPTWNDYGVIIDGGPTYRRFSSYNAGIAPPAPPAAPTSAQTNVVVGASDIYSSDTTQTFNFDAYLFPTAVAAPAYDMVPMRVPP